MALLQGKQISSTIAGSGLTFSSGILSLTGGSGGFSATYSLSAGVTQSVAHGLSTNNIIINTWDETTGDLLILSTRRTSVDNIDIRSSVNVDVRVVIIK